MEFTNEEKEHINQLYGNDFKDVTPDDVSLIRRWERFNALNDAEFQAKQETIATESAARIKALDSKVKQLERILTN